MSMNKLTWGIIGAGDVVLKKSGPALLKAPRSTLKTLMRRNGNEAKKIAAEMGVDNYTTDAAEVINDPDINCIYVATPPSSHREYVLAAAQQGKQVLVEKPMGLNGDEDKEMIGACEKYMVKLFVAYYRRFHPHALKMKELTDSGALGTIVSAAVDFAWPCPGQPAAGWRIEPKISGGGHYADVVSHRIDLLMYLLGEVDLVTGLDTQYDPDSKVEQAAVATILYRSGALATASGDFYSGRNHDRFTITGTRGRIHAEDLSSWEFDLESKDGSEKFVFPREDVYHHGLFKHIEDVLLDAKPNLVSGADGRETDLVLDAVLNRT